MFFNSTKTLGAEMMAMEVFVVISARSWLARKDAVASMNYGSQCKWDVECRFADPELTRIPVLLEGRDGDRDMGFAF